MKSFIVFALLVAAAAAAPAVGVAGPEAAAVVVRSFLDNLGLGPATYDFETSNGIKARSETVLENAGTEDEGISVRGEYSHVGPDGVLYAVSYVADRNGFQPLGAHLPRSP